MAVLAEGTVPRQRSSPAARVIDLTAVLDRRVPPLRVLQPIVDVRAGRVIGYEALARFGQTSTPPTPWFKTAAKMRRSAELEAVLVEAALRCVDTLPRGAFLAVNVSPGHLSTAPVLSAFASQADLSRVVIELTEATEFGDAGDLNERLRPLRARGARLALDDVGAGWAGLRQLTELSPDIVKLDRSLVEGVDRHQVKRAVAEMLLQLCERLGCHLLAEGVESLAELETFARLGVPLAQGWIFGLPTPEPGAIDDDLAVRLKFSAGLHRHVDKIAALVDVTTPTITAPTPSAAEPDVVVTLNADRVPSHVHERVSGHWTTAVATTVQVSEPAPQALLRALTRPPAAKFLPLVCIDKAGRYVGTVGIATLASAVARLAEIDGPLR